METYIFGLKSGQDLKNRAAHPHHEFPGTTPPPPLRVKRSVHTRRHVAATRCRNKSLRLYRRTFVTSNLSSLFGDFLIYFILTISYMRAWTIETSSLPDDSMRPLIKQIEIFFLVFSIYSIKRRPRSNAADGSKTTNKRRT